jgi:hypothetical protein
MKFYLILTAIIFSTVFVSCTKDCEPGDPPLDDRLHLLILNNNNTAYLKYTNAVALPDSVTVINLSNNAAVNRFLVADSVLVVDDYVKTNGATTRLKIQKGPNAKPDTVEAVVSKKLVENNCGVGFEVFRFTSIKMNNSTLCTNCPAATASVYKRP